MAEDRESWKWQLAHRITTVDELSKLINLTPEEKADIAQNLGLFRMAITPPAALPRNFI